MTGNFHTLKIVAADLNGRVSGRTIRCAFTQEADELVFDLEPGPLHIVVSGRPSENTLFLHPAYSRARANTRDLLREAAGLTISSVRIHPADRIVFLQLQDGCRIACLFFGAQSNVLLLDRDNRVIDAFHRSRAEITASFAAESDPPVHDLAAFADAVRRSGDRPLQASLRQSFPALGNELALELLHRCTLPDTVRCSDLADNTLDAVTARVAELLRDLDAPAPRVYIDHAGRPLLFSPVKLLRMESLEERIFPDVHEALRFVVYRRRAAGMLNAERDGILARIDRECSRLERSLLAIERHHDPAERIETYERCGTLLLSHLHEVPTGAAAVVLHDDSGSHTIALDPGLTPAQNAERYFDRARKSRRTASEGTTREAHLTERLALARSLRDAFTTTRSREDVRTLMKERSDDLDALGIGPEAERREQIPFRIFTVDGGFEVWAGKSSENNDLLTFRHARPNDLWFHARGSGGSHVVLRTASAPGEPGKRAKEEAAAIAAYYSKMRNARTVPVAMTERKYVRKPRGARAGTVTLEREKVLFVNPALPGEPAANTGR